MVMVAKEVLTFVAVFFVWFPSFVMIVYALSRYQKVYQYRPKDLLADIKMGFKQRTDAARDFVICSTLITIGLGYLYFAHIDGEMIIKHVLINFGMFLILFFMFIVLRRIR